jgi:hypothetical membrane protein
MPSFVALRVARGEVSIGELARYLLFLAIPLGFLVLAAIMFIQHGSYSILANQISDLGALTKNPSGWYLFSIAMFTGAAVTLPLDALIDKKIKELGIKGGRAVSVLYYLGSIGMAGVGAFPSSWIHATHLASAAVAFGGFAFANFIFFGICFRQKRLRVAWPSVFFIPIAALIITTQAISFGTGVFPADYTFLSFSLWEWTLFFAAIFLIVATSLFLVRASAIQAPN